MHRPFRRRSLGRKDLGKTKSQSARGRSSLGSCTKTKVASCTDVPFNHSGDRNWNRHLLPSLSRCESWQSKVMRSAANSDATCDKLARSAIETKEMAAFQTFHCCKTF